MHGGGFGLGCFFGAVVFAVATTSQQRPSDADQQPNADILTTTKQQTKPTADAKIQRSAKPTGRR